MFPEAFKRRIKENLGVPMLHWSLMNIKRLGFKPSFVVDGGAYQGEWTKEFLEVFPQTKILMLEAQSSKEPFLKRVCLSYPAVQYHIALLSSEDGKELNFVENETASTVVNHSEGACIKKTSESIDRILQQKGLEYPELIKLDVQGFELEVLKGAENALRHAEFCLLEVSLLDYGLAAPSVLDTMNFMDTRGFQAYDICKLMRRPFDTALDQMDMLFINKNSKLISEKRWS